MTPERLAEIVKRARVQWHGVEVDEAIVALADDCDRLRGVIATYDASGYQPRAEAIAAAVSEAQRYGAAWRGYALAMRDMDPGWEGAPQPSDVRAAWDAVCFVDPEARAERDAVALPAMHIGAPTEAPGDRATVSR